MLVKLFNNFGVKIPSNSLLFLYVIILVILNVTFIFCAWEIISGLNQIIVTQQSEISCLKFKIENLGETYGQLLFDKNQEELKLNSRILHKNILLTVIVLRIVGEVLLLATSFF